MARVGKFLHFSNVDVAKTLGTGFSLSHEHTLNWSGATDSTQFFGVVNGVLVRLTSAGSSAKVFIRITKDSAGDQVVVPDTEATLVEGIGTSTTKSAVYRVDLPIHQDLSPTGNKTLYLFARVDAGTPTLAHSQIVWQE